jgi:ADP-heptose:LPS heptosyltransferase
MARLQIYDPRERAIVNAADAVLTAVAALARRVRRHARPAAISRVLLLRLERIGDLLMTLPAIGDLRAAVPSARVDLVVGSWNAQIARAIAAVDSVETLDPAWLARDGRGQPLGRLVRRAWGWRTRRYDLAINFEPDVRSNLLVAAAGARWTVGYRSAGGGPLLDDALDYDPRSHTSDNARRIVAAVFGRSGGLGGQTLLDIPADARSRAEALLAGRPSPLVVMHVPGGRRVKQWDPSRFAEVARALMAAHRGTVILTGTRSDAAVLDEVRSALPPDRVIDLAAADTDLLTVAAVLARADLMITGDTGPMHLAAAVGTPIVAVFGPSDPRRYAPRGPRDRIVRVDLPCAPCNRIRRPPARCTGVTPDCLTLVAADRVIEAATAVLHERASAGIDRAT